MNVLQFIFAILDAIANVPTLRAAVVRPLADLLVTALPNVTEDNVAALLRELADQVEAANP